MKNSKLKIESLKVESFVTTVENTELGAVKGGATCVSYCPCDTRPTGTGPTGPMTGGGTGTRTTGPIDEIAL